MAFTRLTRHFLPVHLETILILLWATSLIFTLTLANNETVSQNEPSKSKKDVKLAVVLRRNVTRPLPLQAPFTETPALAPARQIQQPIFSRNERNLTSKTKEKKKRRRGGKSVETSFPTKVGGVDKEGAGDPEEFIRTALINHTLEHGGEEDLDKLVFSSLPQGSKLILRTVRIIRTDENGDPVDEEEDAQPTYWDVTLANATDTVLDEEEEDEGGGEDDAEEVEENEATKNERKRKGRGGRIGSSDSKGRKKSDLESSGSHAAANYHRLNDYASTGGDKAHAKSHYHGNNHGNSHKHSYTETDGKDVKPYHGEGKGGGDYADEHDANKKDHGERFKSSKRKNKGRKVTGFKRVYHKEEFQRTEHFFDDEEANKIAESFGLSEKKEASNHGSKGDKRKYHGVDAEYLDGKEKKNEHGTHSGYDKGQHSTYKDSEKHGHHRSHYEKGSPQHYGSSLPHSHQNHNHGDSYQYHHQDHGTPDHDHGHPPHSSNPSEHPNHNYHVSYNSGSPPQISAISGDTGRDVGRALYSHISHIPAIIPAPVAHEFSVTELSPIVNSATASDPNVMSIYSNSHQRPPTSYNSGTSHQTFNDTSEGGESEGSQRQGRKRIRGRGRWRKEPNEKRTFFSPKHRIVNADPNFEPSPMDVTPFSVLDTPASHNAQDDGYDNQDKLNAPYSMHNNFDIPLSVLNPGKLMPPPPPPAGGLIYPKPPRWPRRRPRPKATLAPGVEMHLAPEVQMNRLNQLHLSEIPLRHALAYHKLGNRLRYQPPTLLQPNSNRHPPLYEVSTRKSDVEDSDFNYLGKGNETIDSVNNENDSAHYFNHNTRYAKGYLTSTMQPPDGVRNTILGPEPGVYSTIIKVLPATMMNVNDSASNHKYSTITASGSSVSVTARPVSAADSISITTEAPQVSQQSLQQQSLQHQQQQQQQLQQYRPFLPLPRQRPPWITINLNHPSNFAQNPHLHHPQTQRPTNFVQEIRNGLLRPFRGPRPPPPPTLLPAPTMTAAAGGQTLQLQKIPTMQIPVQVPYRRRHPLSRLNLFGRYHSPPPRSHYYNPLGRLPQNNMGLSTAVVPPELFPASPFNLKPKFYYNHFYTPVNISDTPSSSTSSTDENAKSTTEKSTDDSTSTSPSPTTRDSNSGGSSMTSTVIAAPKSITLTTTTTSSSASNMDVEVENANRRKEAKPPNFLNGLMDSVSGFFGRVG